MLETRTSVLNNRCTMSTSTKLFVAITAFVLKLHSLIFSVIVKYVEEYSSEVFWTVGGPGDLPDAGSSPVTPLSLNDLISAPEISQSLCSVNNKTNKTIKWKWKSTMISYASLSQNFNDPLSFLWLNGLYTIELHLNFK